MGKLNDILTGFETALKTITVNNDYQLTVRRVDRNFIFVEVDKFPSIWIVADWGDYNEVTSNKSRIPKDFIIYGYVKDKAALQSTMVKMLEDITRCIGKNQKTIAGCDYVDITGAGPAKEVFPGGYGEAPGFMYPFGCVKIACSVEYTIDNEEGG